MFRHSAATGWTKLADPEQTGDRLKDRLAETWVDKEDKTLGGNDPRENHLSNRIPDFSAIAFILKVYIPEHAHTK